MVDHAFTQDRAPRAGPISTLAARIKAFARAAEPILRGPRPGPPWHGLDDLALRDIGRTAADAEFEAACRDFGFAGSGAARRLGPAVARDLTRGPLG